MSSEELIEEIRKKVQVLANHKNQLSRENEALKNEVASLKIEVSHGKAEIEDVKGRLKIVKMAKSLEATGEKSTDSKNKINQLVKEIDKCIAMLSN